MPLRAVHSRAEGWLVVLSLVVLGAQRDRRQLLLKVVLDLERCALAWHINDGDG